VVPAAIRRLLDETGPRGGGGLYRSLRRSGSWRGRVLSAQGSKPFACAVFPDGRCTGTMSPASRWRLARGLTWCGSTCRPQGAG